MKELTLTATLLACLAAAPAMAGSITEKVTGCETYVNEAGQMNLVNPGCLGRSAGGGNTARGGFLNAAVNLGAVTLSTPQPASAPTQCN